MKEEKDYTRKERLEGLKAMVAFLEANEEFDLPESIEHGLVRTLSRTNRGDLQDKQSRADWFLKHVNLMKPDKISTDEDFYAIKYFGGGAKIVVELDIYEVAEKEVESWNIQETRTLQKTTYVVPEELVKAGFKPDQEKLRLRDELYRSFSGELIR